MSGRIRLLVLQWAEDADALEAVEDELTALARSHGATVRRDRARALEGYGTAARPPDEVHAVDFPDRAAFEAYLDDPAREPLRVRLGDAMDRTEVWVLEAMDDETLADD